MIIAKYDDVYLLLTTLHSLACITLLDVSRCQLLFYTWR